MTDARPVGIAVVTGGARRIGRAIVEDLAAHGWSVAIHFHQSRAEAERLAKALYLKGARTAVVYGDLADTRSLDRIVGEAEAALGAPTLLVNNASIFERDTVGSLDIGLYERQMAINLAAPVFLAEAVAKRLSAEAEGNVINIIDERIWRPTPRYFSYQISKSGLAAATIALAQSLAPRIRVNGIAPGPSLPNINQDAVQFRRMTERLPLGRGPDLAEFGRTVRYLVENRSITGQVIGLDGGEHLAWEGDVTNALER
jgi:NAD(P)-dependent dehydrogenase (short-subunit alcohol dehydrogenase family)